MKMNSLGLHKGNLIDKDLYQNNLLRQVRSSLRDFKMEWKEKVFGVLIFRVIISLFFFLRGLFFLSVNNLYKGVSDLCWLYRVSNISLFKSLSFFFLTRLIGKVGRTGQNAILESFLKNKYSSSCKEQYSQSGKGKLDIFRDIILLKHRGEKEKGVILIKYTPTFDAFLSFFDINKILKDYYIVLEPSWAGYCDPSILMFISNRYHVFIQCFTDDDFHFIEQLSTKLVPIRLGPADWVDSEVFVSRIVPEKKYDIIMVANWGRHKRHDMLFKALEKIRDRRINVLLIGFDWGGRIRQDVEREARKIDGNWVRIELKENLSQVEIAQHLVESRMFLFLSKKEGDNKSIVEAFFCNVPAIVLKDTIGGARYRIDEQTGIFSSYEDLHKSILYMLDHADRFSPRSWAIKHTGSSIATKMLNLAIRQIAVANREPFTTDVVEKTNSPNLTYKIPATRSLFEEDYRLIRTFERVGCDYRPASKENHEKRNG
jgi:glycosyltransferase involved in cell wall biosynthesis